MKEAVAVLKLPLEVDNQTADILDGQSRICNWLYNQLLDKANALRKQYQEHPEPHVSKTLYSKLGLRNLVPMLKTEHSFLKVVHSSPLKKCWIQVNCFHSSLSEIQKRKTTRQDGVASFSFMESSLVFLIL